MSRMPLSSRVGAVAAGTLVAAVATVARGDGPHPVTQVPPPATAGAARTGAAEAIPATLALLPRVVLVDEGPFRGLRPHVRDLPDASRSAARKHGNHGHRPYHPAPGIVVEVTHADGGLEVDELQRAARNLGYWPIRRCYEEGLRHNQRLSGSVLLAVTVDSRGAVAGETVPSATVDDESVVLCVAREVEHLSFAASSAETSARMSVSLFTGDEPVPLPYSFPHAAELREGLRAYWPQLESCYRRGLARHSDVGGAIDLHFRVSVDGEVLEVTEQPGASRFADADVTRCVIGTYTGATLPVRVAGAAESTFEYSLHFESALGN
jgi:hypothetical protein